MAPEGLNRIAVPLIGWVGGGLSFGTPQREVRDGVPSTGCPRLENLPGLVRLKSGGKELNESGDAERADADGIGAAVVAEVNCDCNDSPKPGIGWLVTRVIRSSNCDSDSTPNPIGVMRPV